MLKFSGSSHFISDLILLVGVNPKNGRVVPHSIVLTQPEMVDDGGVAQGELNHVTQFVSALRRRKNNELFSERKRELPFLSFKQHTLRRM